MITSFRNIEPLIPQHFDPIKSLILSRHLFKKINQTGALNPTELHHQSFQNIYIDTGKKAKDAEGSQMLKDFGIETMSLKVQRAFGEFY